MAAAENIDFFHYAQGNAPKVWQAYQHIISSGLPVSAILAEPAYLFIRDEPDRRYHLHNTMALSESQVTALTETSAYYIETPPLVHPAFSTLIAKSLSINKEELTLIAAGEYIFAPGTLPRKKTNDTYGFTGPYYIKTLLEEKENITIGHSTIQPAQLLITGIPLLPAKLRPMLPGLCAATCAGVDNISYLLIAKLAKRILSLGKTGSSGYTELYKMLYNYFNRLIIAVEFGLAGNQWAVSEKWRVLKNTDTVIQNPKHEIPPGTMGIPLYRSSYTSEQQQIPVEIISLNEQECCIQYPEQIIIYNTGSGEPITTLSVKNYKIHRFNKEEGAILFFGCPLNGEQLSGFMIYRYVENKWMPADAEKDRCIELSHYTERLVLVNYNTGDEILMPELYDPPAIKIHSACGQYFWIEDKHGNGGVYRVDTGLCVLAGESLHHLPQDDLPVFDIPEKQHNTDIGVQTDHLVEQALQKNYFERGALVIQGSSCTALRHELLYHNGQPILVILYPYCCAAFNITGSTLFLAGLSGVLAMDIQHFTQHKEINYRWLNTANNNSNP